MSNKKLQRTIESLQRKFEDDSPEAVKQVYDDWAGTYDDDLATLGYAAPQNAVTVLADLLPNRDSLILDAGCGTGLVGHYLRQEGYGRLHGSDYSLDMLAEAQKTGHYEWVGVVDMTRPFPLTTDTYAAALCVGVLGPRLSAVPMIPELVRVMQPGGLLLVVIREQWYEDRLQAAVEQLVESKQVAIVQDVIRPYFVSGGVNGRYLALRKQ
jgi:predicted TPR repeat methyltransferase